MLKFVYGVGYVLFGFIFIAVLIANVIAYVAQPHLTQMQFVLQYWYLSVLLLVSGLLCRFSQARKG